MLWTLHAFFCLCRWACAISHLAHPTCTLVLHPWTSLQTVQVVLLLLDTVLQTRPAGWKSENTFQPGKCWQQTEDCCENRCAVERMKSDFFFFFFGFIFLCQELSLAFSRSLTHDTVLSHQHIVCIYKCFFFLLCECFVSVCPLIIKEKRMTKYNQKTFNTWK